MCVRFSFEMQIFHFPYLFIFYMKKIRFESLHFEMLTELKIQHAANG